MRELVWRTRRAEDGQGNWRRYVYTVLVEEDPWGGENYGVRVSGEEGWEEVRRITPSARRIGELADLLSAQVVTPLHLRAVVEDWL